jgi:hypothetical protein
MPEEKFEIVGEGFGGFWIQWRGITFHVKCSSGELKQKVLERINEIKRESIGKP